MFSISSYYKHIASKTQPSTSTRSGGVLSGWFRLISCVGLMALLSACQLADMARFVYDNANSNHLWASDQHTTTVPFTLVDNHIIVPVLVNGGEPLNFVLDSGAAATVIIDSRRSRALQLEMGGKITVSGPGTGPDPVAYIVRDTTVSLGDVSLEKLSVIYLPLDSIPFFEDLDDVYFDGVIGAHFFSRFIVEINYDESEISLTELPTGDYQPKSPADHWQEVALEIDGGVSYLVAQVDAGPEEAVEVKLLVDTGYRGAISVTPETHADLDAPLEYFEDVSEGLSGDVVSHVAMTDLLTVGGYNLNRLPLSYALAGGESESGSNGILGNDVLQHFNLVFDYHNERLLMAPNQNFAMPIDVDRSGLQLRPHVRGAVVRRIATGSAAEASSLKVGDIITEYNGTPVTYKSISELKRTLASELDRVRLCWMSGETRQCADLSLASRFEEGVAVTASGT